MNKLQSLKRHFYMAKLWLLLGGDFLFGNPTFTFVQDSEKAKYKALRQALAALEAIGQRPRGGSRYARATHMFLTTQLQGSGVVL